MPDLPPPGPETPDVPELLARVTAAPDDRAAAERVFAAVHAELQVRAARRMRGNVHASWSATDLVHETYLKMMGAASPPARSRSVFLAIASNAMRQVLIDHVRAKGARKRGGDRRQVTLSGLAADSGDVDVELVDLERALGELESLDPRMARVVELRFFGGLSMDEIATELGVTRRTVQRDWRVARSWLLRRLTSDAS